MNKLLISIVLTTGFLLSGCVTKIESAQMILKDETKETIRKKIKEGKTTQNQIRETFGEPTSAHFDGGTEIWSYSYYSQEQDVTSAVIPYVSLFNYKTRADFHQKELTIFFNNNIKKTVNRYTFYESNSQLNDKTRVGR
ncbi:MULTISPECIES: outer membrane protein assembly factor BamE domain-containing protein [unclassified Gilliamella]|uniref:outer membrane protein assembly factor BamE domain-containing protein n=1 Tax=unclassified Gilliamella TaxID=2685620 RepID=UPI0013288114|nr:MULTISPECIES: outer membrane protein assembly factor BamE [unclassified Gilliamella]MWN30870.1 outer membrane protein assembly factor BamE [Gilliamella sp. Pra-s60]MWP28565.1 outer membrane protein assembly factor BamE [Gilliamella sp. Pra-s54]